MAWVTQNPLYQPESPSPPLRDLPAVPLEDGSQRSVPSRMSSGQARGHMCFPGWAATRDGSTSGQPCHPSGASPSFRILRSSQVSLSLHLRLSEGIPECWGPKDDPPLLANKIKIKKDLLILDTLSVKRLKARNILQILKLITPSSSILQRTNLRCQRGQGMCPGQVSRGQQEPEGSLLEAESGGRLHTSV